MKSNSFKLTKKFWRNQSKKYKRIFPRHNTEKVIYFLLLDRKLKNPCDEDNDEVLSRSRTIDPPRKRVDKFKTSGGQYSQLTVGSPVVGRRGFVHMNHGPRHQSCHTTPLQSPCTSPIVTSKDMFNTRDSSQTIDSDSISISSNNSNNINQQIRSRINSFKITMFSAPKFYRRKKTNNSVNSKYKIKFKFVSSKKKSCHV